MIEYPYSFASDNYAGIHPHILQAIIDANHGHATAYGDDLYTKAAEEKFNELFGQKTQSFLKWNSMSRIQINRMILLTTLE